MFRYIMAGAAVVCMFLSPAGAWQARDADDRWVLDVPPGWLGGSYYQMTEIIKDSRADGDGQNLTVYVLEMLARKARSYDAVFLNFDELYARDPAKTRLNDASLITVKTQPLNSSFPGPEVLDDDFWDRYAELFVGDIPRTLGFEVLQHQNDLGTEEMPVAWASIRIKMPENDRYYAMIFIFRDDEFTRFDLRSLFRVAGPRLEEMWGMVQRIRFIDGDGLSAPDRSP